MNNWVVTYTLRQDRPDEDQMVQLSEDLDISVAGSNSPEKWYVTVHVSEPNATKAFTAANKFMADTPLKVEAATSVQVETLDEYEIRAFSPTLPELLGAAEVGELLHVSRQRVHQLSSRPDFPAPVLDLRMGPAWDRVAIEKFERQWSRSPGRPRRNSKAS